jgi:hypothetical protein
MRMENRTILGGRPPAILRVESIVISVSDPSITFFSAQEL